VTPKVFIPLEIEILFSAGDLEEFCTSAIVVDFLLKLGRCKCPGRLML
jgi:hypothetical protein